MPPENQACNDTMMQFDNLWDNNINIYDIFGHCFLPNTTDAGLRSAKEGDIQPRKKPYFTASDYTPWRFKGKPGSNDQLGGVLPPCTFGGPIIDYLSGEDVMKQLNIPTNIPKYNESSSNWNLCVGQ